MERLRKPSLLDVALAAVITLTVPAEYHWARAAGWDWWNAAAWPVAADAYVLQALRAHKDQMLAMALMGGSVAAAHILPGEYPNGLPPLILGIAAAVAAGILWRVERLQAGLRRAARAEEEARAAAKAAAEAADGEIARQRQLEEDGRRATAVQEEANRLEATRQDLERAALEQRARELAEQEAARKAADREQRRQDRPQRPAARPEAGPGAAPGAEDILLPAARKAADRIRARGESVTRDRLRDQLIADGKLTGGRRNERAGALLQLLRDEERRAG